jgi:hypothetical protein
MKTRKRLKSQNHAQPVEARRLQRIRNPLRGEEGQSMLEMTVGVIFLLLVVLVLFEMAMLFYSYIAALNASREGAVFASLYPDVREGDPLWGRYVSIINAEAEAAGLNPDYLTVYPPEAPVTQPLSPVIVKVDYELLNPTQGIFLPILGRMGLFQSAKMTAKTEMPIR